MSDGLSECHSSLQSEEKLKPAALMNDACPYSGKPANTDFSIEYEGKSIGFCSQKHRDKFKRTLSSVLAIIAQPESRKRVVNSECPDSGKPVKPAGLVRYQDHLICFCGRKHADAFLGAMSALEEIGVAGSVTLPDQARSSGGAAVPMADGPSGHGQVVLADAQEKSIIFTANPIAFIDQIVTRHKAWLAQQPVRGESSAYMNEAVEQQGRGSAFMNHYVHGTGPKHGNPEVDARNWALLELYEYWRNKYGMRPIEVWNGTRLRPWLPAKSNPKVPKDLKGDLSHFTNATLRGWSLWDPIDALGISIDGYFTDIRKHHVWAKPKRFEGGDQLRLYRFNELNNIETAPYSIRFWGFLKFAEQLRCKLHCLPFDDFEPTEADDITFMDEFNKDHFPWHDDVFGRGRCPDWRNQHGKRQQHKYPMKTYGMGLEFLQFHGDLLAKYNGWLKGQNRPTTDTWRDGNDPWQPGIHHSAHILRQFAEPWGLAGTNGEQLNPEDVVPELFDPELRKFDTVSELGSFMEKNPPGYHGSGHLEHCDIRDVYTNNYSLRFFHWHQWLETFRQALKARGKPDHFAETDPRKLDSPWTQAFLDQFKKQKPRIYPFEGTWTYRSYHNEPTINEDNPASFWFSSNLTLTQTGLDDLGRVMIEGELNNGRSRYEMTGYVDHRNVHYELTPDWWDERNILILVGKGTGPYVGHEYRYRFHLVPEWPGSHNQTPALVGSMMRAVRPDNPSLEGTVGSFVAVKQDD